MVLESLVNPTNAEKKPMRMFYFGFLICTIGIFLSRMVFKENSSLVMVFLTTIAAIPLIYNTIKMEEQKDIDIWQETALLKEHGKALSFFIFLFLGMTIASAFWYVALPTDMSNEIFSMQTDTITKVNSRVDGAVIQFGAFKDIFFNNFRVLIFCILFAFVYGTGAIFVLTWNAYVIGTAIGNFIRAGVSSAANSFGFVSVGNYFSIVSIGLLKYVIHGVPEILAYFTAGLAGGIISIAVIKHNFGSPQFKKVVMDSADMLVISVVILVAAAALEVYVTPLFF